MSIAAIITFIIDESPLLSESIGDEGVDARCPNPIHSTKRGKSAKMAMAATTTRVKTAEVDEEEDDDARSTGVASADVDSRE